MAAVVGGASLPSAAASPGATPVVAPAPPVVTAGSCYTTPEVRASQVRQLQTELMVAALSCTGYPDLALRDRYNAFVQKFGGSLNSTATVLRGHFQRNHGREHSRRFDAYITSLANQAALRSFDEPSYCQTAGSVFEALSGLDPREIEAYAAREVEATEAVMPCAGSRS